VVGCSLIFPLKFKTSESRPDMPVKYWKVPLEKDGEDQLDWSCEKWRGAAYGHGRKEDPVYSRGRKVNWVGHRLWGNCLLKNLTVGKIEGRIEGRGRWGKRRKQLSDDLKEKENTWNFYIHGSVHRESNRITVQQDATLFSLLHFCRQLYMFRVFDIHH